MVRTIKTYAAACAALVAFIVPAFAEEAMTHTIESYFTDLKSDFTVLARSPIVTNTRPTKEINACFKKMVKRHQPLASVMKTNAAGMVVNWYARNEKTPRRKFSVAKQPWFQRPQKTLMEYNCLLKEENGRYYVYWSIPLIRTVRGARRFDGAVVAKVDVWDCFFKIASRCTDAFLIRLKATTLYEHLWENKRIFVEEPLSIPGIEKISVRYQKSGVSVVAPSREKETAVPAVAETATVAAAAPAPQRQSGMPQRPYVARIKSTIPIIAALFIFIAVVLTLLIMYIVGPSRPAKRLRPLRKDEHFPFR